MVAAATDEEYDEAFVVFPVSIDPGSDGRCLNNKENSKVLQPYNVQVYIQHNYQL